MYETKILSKNDFAIFTISKQKFKIQDAKIVAVDQPEVKSFSPTKDLIELELFAPDLLDEIATEWTPEVVERWEEYISQTEA